MNLPTFLVIRALKTATLIMTAPIWFPLLILFAGIYFLIIEPSADWYDDALRQWRDHERDRKELK